MSKGRGMSTDRSHDAQPLLWLCIAQGCERFAFVSMLPLFAQYVQERHGMSAPMALSVLSIFQALSYLGGLPGGWFADHKIWAKAASVMGALLLASGYVCMLGSVRTALWMSLALLIAGHSVFRPALHVRIASVIAATPHERERGFLWYYLAANLGYAAGGWFGEWAHRAHGWNAVFVGAASACTAAGVALISCRTLSDSRSRSAAEPIAPDATHSLPRSVRAVWLLCGISVIFWLTAQQAGTSLTVFAANHVTHHVVLLGHALRIGPGHFALLHGLMVIAPLSPLPFSAWSPAGRIPARGFVADLGLRRDGCRVHRDDRSLLVWRRPWANQQRMVGRVLRTPVHRGSAARAAGYGLDHATRSNQERGASDRAMVCGEWRR